MPTPAAFPRGCAVTLEQLDRDPHPVLAGLREHEPVSWVQALGGWLVTRHDLALAVLDDATTFTVQDERFSTAQVIGSSMLSLDGHDHERHRAPFSAPFRPQAVRERFAQLSQRECARLLDELASAGGCELRGDFAGPLATRVLTRALGLPVEEAGSVRAWYEAIVAAVTELTAGRPLPRAGAQAFAQLAARLRAVIEGGTREQAERAHDGASLLGVAAAQHPAALTTAELISNAAVLLFGGIETTEAMITTAALYLLRAPEVLSAVRAGGPDAAGALELVIEESLRLEPAAAMLDRYATADVELAGAQIAAGDLVRVSLTATGRDPSVFADPDRFLIDPPRPRRHLAFARGPHVCLGVHLARLQARTALAALVSRWPQLRLDAAHRPEVRGLVFRKPPALQVRWDATAV